MAAFIYLIPPISIKAAVPQEERDALVALFNNTGGPDWKHKTNWLGAAGTECTWYGLTCDGTESSVINVSLNQNRLSGSIPSVLGNLTNLKILNLRVNSLSGSIPAELGSLNNLIYLDLGSNQLGGNIPAELGNLNNLLTLVLYLNQLEGGIPAELGNLRNLTYLDLSWNQLSGSIPAELGNISNLQSLYIGANHFSGSIASFLASLTNLQNLGLDGNQLGGSIPAELGNLTNLQRLDLAGNQLNGKIPAELGNLTNLQRLNLAGNQLSGSIPAELGSLTNLQILNLMWNQLDGGIPAEFGNLDNLQTLYLAENKLSGSIPAELGNLTKLQIIYLGTNQLSGSIPAELGNLSNLQSLDLTENQLSGSIPPFLVSLTNLRDLGLSNNQFGGSIPEGLGSLKNLSDLGLRSNQLSGSIPAELGDLANLIFLDLASNQLSGNIPAELGNLKNLQSLDLSSNQLSGRIPIQIAQLRPTWYEQPFNLSYNALYATDSGLRSFLNSKAPGWQDTQTIAPANITAAAQTGSSILVSWNPILYAADSGRYEIFVSTESNGSYTFAGSTPTKQVSNLRISGLNLAATYYFIVRTVTDPNPNNQNTVESEYSAEVSALTNADKFSANLSLSSGGTAYVSTTGDAGQIQVGYATLELNSGGVPYAIAVFSYKQDGITVTEAGVPASLPTAHASVFIDYRNGVDSIPSHSEAGKIDINTGIAVVNTGLETSNIVYTLRDMDGNPIASGTETLNAGAHISRFISELSTTVDGFELPVDFQTAIQFGTLEIMSDQPLSVLALRMTTNQRGEVLYTTTPVANLMQTPAADSVYFAQFADGGGYTSSLILLNATNATETGNLQILDSDGAPMTVSLVGNTSGSSFRYAIAPGGAFLLRTDGFPEGAKTGWVKLVPDAGTATPIGSAVFGFNRNGVLVSESGVPAALSTTHARVYVDLTGNHNTGLAIANLNVDRGSVKIKAFQTDGVTPIGTSLGPLVLAGNGNTAQFAHQFVEGLPVGFIGILDISSKTPFAALTVRSLNNQRGDFLFTTFPVADMTREAPSPIVFPQIADSGGYISEFIFLGSAGASTSTLNFYNNSGGPLEFEN
jgi:Leucine-rich repeat (LRR) protein